MTSPTKQSAIVQAKAELEIFNELPRPVRDAMNECEASPPRASIVLAALLRGVSEKSIIETIKRSQDNARQK